MKKISIGILIASFLVVGVALALDLRSSGKIDFTGHHDITVDADHPNPFRLNSVVMSFDLGPQTNTFKVMLRKGGAGNWVDLLTASGVYTNVGWDGMTYDFHLNDVIRFTNSVNTKDAELIYDYEI